MKTTGRIITIFLFFVSCTPYRSATNVNMQQLGKIWENQIRVMDKMPSKELQKKGYSAIEFSSDSALYFAKDTNKVLASIFCDTYPNERSFKNRYEELKATHNEGELGSKLLSSDSKRNGNDGVFAIEYILTDESEKKLYFHMEAFINGQVVTSGIITDQAHREDAIKLIDMFTKRLSNTKLHL